MEEKSFLEVEEMFAKPQVKGNVDDLNRMYPARCLYQPLANVLSHETVDTESYLELSKELFSNKDPYELIEDIRDYCGHLRVDEKDLAKRELMLFVIKGSKVILTIDRIVGLYDTIKNFLNKNKVVITGPSSTFRLSCSKVIDEECLIKKHSRVINNNNPFKSYISNKPPRKLSKHKAYSSRRFR